MGFGIDHPLIAVSHLDDALRRAADLGFVSSMRYSNPWGADIYALMLPTNCIELISITQPEKTGYVDPNGFRFARVIEARLKKGEGIAMLALDSQSIAHDHALIEARGFGPWEPTEFERTVHTVSGTTDVRVILDILHDPSQPFLTQYLYKQSNEEQLRNSGVDRHPNAVSRVKSVWYVSDDLDRDLAYFRLIHGDDHIVPVNKGGFRIDTDQGLFWVLSPAALAEEFTTLGEIDAMPARGVALSLETTDLEAAIAHWEHHSVPYERISRSVAEVPANVLGNTIFRFEQCEDCLL